MDLTDDYAPSERRSRRWLLVSVLVAVIAMTAWVDITGDSRVRGQSAAADHRLDRTDASLDVVRIQQETLEAEDREGFLATWTDAPASQRLARQVFDNLTRLDAEVTLTVGPTDAGVADIDPAAAWQLIVSAQWNRPALHTRPAVSALQYTFEPDGSTAGKVSDVSAVAGATAPFWLADRLAVRRGAGWMVAASTPATARAFANELQPLSRGVRDLVPNSPGAVTVYVPSDVDSMRETVGRIVGGVERLAGIVVSTDGSTGSRAPVMVVLNPDQLESLSRQGLRAVLAHELTHAITGAGVVTMPMWLAEGFADYVGVEVANVPVRRATRIARRDVVDNGLPRELPGNLAFAGGSYREVELAYQQSRLAVVAMVERFGERAVLQMYQHVVAHPGDVRAALRTQLGTSLGEVKQSWRAELRELADG